jgi:branched-chain amino acid transport system substrate-binding protein
MKSRFIVLDGNFPTTYFQAMLARFLLAVALALAPAAVRAQPVLVGVVVPQSGMLADLAADLKKGLLLWQQEVNDAGGLLGRRVELRIEDDASDSLLVGGLYEKLIKETGAEALVGPFGSAASAAAAAVAERNRRVLLNATGISRAVHRRSPRYVFQVPAPLAAYGAGALELARRLEIKRVVLMSRSDPLSREMAERAREKAHKLGIESGELGSFSPGTRDFDAQVARAKASGAQGWIGFGSAQDAAEMVKSFRKAGYAPRLFAAQGVADPKFIELVGQDAEHAIGISPYERRAATRGNAQFAESYAKQFSASPTHLAAEGYAAGKVLEEAVRSAGSLDQDKLREALATLETETPLGGYRVDKSGVQLAAQPLLVQIRGGRREIVWPEALATAKLHFPYPAWGERKPIQ